jgi:SAM-dependent methyltransferase
MADSADLLRQESHFAFGKNWASYARLVTEEQIQEAVRGLQRLVGDDLSGQRFLDIGCGSGLHSLAAIRLGAREVVCIDIDPDSVATTRATLAAHAPDQKWQAHECSIFDVDALALGSFDLVYSWGVLHHTGDMNRALRTASALVAPGGRFALALYRKTRMCGFWKAEKRWYAGASPLGQAVARGLFLGVFRLTYAVTRQSFRDYVSSYKSSRGMDFRHDIHDWLGGWPYESIAPEETQALMAGCGLELIADHALHRIKLGLLGSGCDEYVFARPQASAPQE